MYNEISRFIEMHCPKLRRLQWDNEDNHGYWSIVFNGDVESIKDYLLSVEALYSN